MYSYTACLLSIRKRPKFRFGSIRGSADFGRFDTVRFGKNFAELFVIQFNAHLQYLQLFLAVYH